MIKRFNISSVTRSKEYFLTKSSSGSKVVYLSSNPNGEAETITISLRKNIKLKTLKFDYNFADLAIKGKGSGGNILTKNKVKKVELKSTGVSTLSARKIWFDYNVNRINVDSRGNLIGEFAADDKILTINKRGYSEIKGFDISTHFDEDMLIIEKFNPEKPLSVIYFDGKKNLFFVKRFLLENISNKFLFISDHKGSYLDYISTDWRPQAEIIFVKEKGKDRRTEIIDLESFISIKGARSIGNKLTNSKVKEIIVLDSLVKNIEKKDIKKKIDIPFQITNEEVKINQVIKLNEEDDDDDGQTSLKL